jgi:hypothetical protein
MGWLLIELNVEGLVIGGFVPGFESLQRGLAGGDIGLLVTHTLGDRGTNRLQVIQHITVKVTF